MEDPPKPETVCLEALRLEVCPESLGLRVKYGPLICALQPFRESPGTLRGTCRAYSRHMRIPGLRGHTGGPWFQP